MVIKAVYQFKFDFSQFSELYLGTYMDLQLGYIIDDLGGLLYETVNKPNKFRSIKRQKICQQSQI
ncbi:hypothetical protein GCM10007063_24890 [Lentibacillus kapialis]|uniref:Uncharacterized protein n=1 Tax=Lentibacillus kapialis TaxID=340214 RepID=A0A917PZB5_9BACI|nr:hypothetical protein GCM10007063_24890 [Lentibacillus kapialis]